MRGVVAITGATGFVGAAAARHLAAAGWHVRVLVRRLPQDALSTGHRLEVVLGDLDDTSSLEKLLRGCNAIIHCAGLVRALTPLEFFLVNEGGTARLLQAAAIAAPNARFLHISSLAAREFQLSPYAASKRAAEIKLAALAGKRPWLALRPPAVYGPGDLELLPLFKAAQLGFLAYPASRDARVSTIHVEDLASAVTALLEAENWLNSVLEIDDEHPGGYDWPDIITALSTCFGRRPLAYRLPRAMMVPIAQTVSLVSAMTGRPKVLSRHKVAELYHPEWLATGPRLSSLIPWRPRFDLSTGFADSLAWYRTKALL